jgi:RNA polymerase sigma-B factor
MTSTVPASAPEVSPATVDAERVDRSVRTQHVLERLRLSDDAAERERMVEELVVLNLAIAHAIAVRYRGRGPSFDDLEQVARLGLVKAAQGFDPDRNDDFLAYAVPTIRGEVRKYFRDHGWMVRPPRRVQEMQSQITRAAHDLTQALGRSPRPSEVAHELGVPPEDVQEALSAEGCFSPSSLDRPVARPDGDGTAVLGDLLVAEDRDQDAAEARLILAPAVRRLCERDRRIIRLRFFDGCTQEEIARDIGVTQMHVSRLITRILEDLRTEIADTAGTATPRFGVAG